MSWSLEEAIVYYQTQGAPADQSALVSLLRETQTESGGRLTKQTLAQIARVYGLKESFLAALVKRIPSLRMDDRPCLELCAGPNCLKRAQLAAFVETRYGTRPETFTLKYVPCMRLCGKGPNIRWDGQLYHNADEDLIRRLVEGR